MIRIISRAALAFGVVLLASVGARADQIVKGTPPFGSFTGGPFDTINVANGNIHFRIPILVKAGRGLPFNFQQSYDSLVWVKSGGTWAPTTGWGWRGVTQALLGKVVFDTTQGTCSVGGQNYYYNIYSGWRYPGPDGFAAQGDGTISVSDQSTSTPPGCSPTGPPYSTTITAKDASGFTLSVTAAPSATVYPRSGGSITAPLNSGSGSGTMIDSNGNEITVTASTNTTFTDTLGTTAITAAGSGTPSSPITYTYTPAAGGSAQVTVNYTAYTVQTNFACSGVTEYGPTSQNLVSSISLPDGTSYSFTYEPTPGHAANVTARIASVTLATGGTISYSYSGGSNGIVCASDGNTATLTRATPDGTWTYARTESGTSWTTTITDPQNNQTVYSVKQVQSGSGWAYETQRQVYQGSVGGTLLETVDTCYNGATIPCTGTSITLPINNVTAQTTLGSVVAKTYSTFNTYGLLTELDEYGYGTGSPGAMVRKKLLTYATLGNNISDRVGTKTVQNGSGGTVQSISNTYGNTVTSTSGTPQHVSVSGDRGNLVSITIGSFTPSLTRNFTYFDTGMVQTATDTKGNTTSYTVSGCGNSFVTSVNLPMSLSRSATWNCNGAAQKASDTDQNSQVTNYSYDSMNRATQTTFPDGGWTLISYTGATQQDIYAGITDTTPSSSCTSCRHDRVVLDSQGRVSSNVLVNDPEGATTVATTYDSLGRVYTTTNPYRSTSDPTYGFDTRAYDAVNRVTSVTRQDGNAVTSSYSNNCVTVTDEASKARKTCSDALGRVTQVVEDPSGLNLETDYQFDALDNLTQVTQGVQTRSYTFDGVPRKTAETTPEAGTVNFYYTTSGNALCSGDPQEVCRRTDARSITTTYSYDALNRLTSKTYSDTTPTVSYYYDEASVTLNGTNYTLTNTKGRLSHTVASSGNARTIHSYDTMGRTVDLWQCSPYNCGSAAIWNLHYNYDLAGDISSWRDAGANTFTHTVSNAQRITQITSSWTNSTHPGTLATSITYAPQGAVSKMVNGCSGTGCTQRQETYDHNNRLQVVRIQLGTSGSPNANNCMVYNHYSGVGNPTSCSIPSQASSGDDGSVVGHFFQNTTNPSLGHSTSATYDGLHRLGTSVATGSSTHNLTFSYDRYGNMTCVVNGNTNGPCGVWSFNSSTNRITNANFTYDSSGNLTQDGTGVGTHTYQWDAEGRMKSVDGGSTATYTFNALDWRVEKKTGSSTFKEYIYTPQGIEADASDRSVSCCAWEYLFLGSRRFGKYVSNVTRFMHQDNLGSATTVTDYAGAVYQDKLYYPWGQQWALVGSEAETLFARFHTRDTETNLDPTHFRMFSSTEGRWLSPDPKAGRGMNPQSHNRYAYAFNSPGTLVDRSGLTVTCWTEQVCVRISGEYPSGNIIAVSCTTDFVCLDTNAPPPPLPTPTAGPSGSTGAAGGGAGGGGSGSTPQQLLQDAKNRVAADLGKPSCAQDFNSPLAPCINALANAKFGNLGPVSPQEFTIAQEQNNQITLNTYVIWANPQSYLVDYTKSQTLAPSISPAQFMDIWLLHEMYHIGGKDNPDKANVMSMLWWDCIK